MNIRSLDVNYRQLLAGVMMMCCLGTSFDALAHYIWIERDARGAKLYFGEINEVREQSPGRLDEIAAPVAWADKPDSRFNIVRTAMHLNLQGPLAPQLLAHELTIEVKDWTKNGIGIVKPMFYTRNTVWPVDRTPSAQHQLDIVPIGASKTTFQVYFAGKPLSKARVNVYAPNDWMQDHRADENGLVKLSMPWRGQYLLEVIHKDEVGGEYKGKKFDAHRHRVTITLSQKHGISIAGTKAESSTEMQIKRPPVGMMANTNQATK